MSTIERAMRKLNGEPDVPADERDEAPSVAAELEAADREDDGDEDTPEVAAAPVAPTSTATGTEKRSAGRQALSTVDDYQPVDLERLKSRGFLVPGQGEDRQGQEYQHIKRRLLGNMVPGILQAEAPTNLIMVTSSLPGEGKTFTSVNLAISIALEMDRTVLLVDADVIKTDSSRMFNLHRHPGLFDWLTDPTHDIGEYLVHTSIPKLVMLPSGLTTEQSTEKLASDAMRALTTELATRYPDRVIIFDCPPILATTGAVALSRFVGQIVMVVEAGKTTQETLKHALNAMEHVQITGMILNKSKQALASSKYYGYYGYYGAARPAD